MAKFSEIKFADVTGLWKKLDESLPGSPETTEGVAQHLTELVYNYFKESLVLIRVFITIPYGQLPLVNRQFVDRLAQSNGITDLIKAETPILSLIGTYGENPQWNNRHKSSGHIGIPLASVDFIDKIPMMSRLLKQLGMSLDWISNTDTKIVSRTVGNLSGVFYVPDAKTSVDELGRNIIAAQDFVAKYKVKTVFGFGGSYMLKNSFSTIIFFTREEIDKTHVEQLMRIISIFKTHTTRFVDIGKILS